MESNLNRVCSNQFFSIVSVLFIVSVALVVSSPVGIVLGEGYYYREFGWDYAGSHWTWNLTIPKSLYSEYQGVSVSQRVKNGPAGYGFLATTRNSYVTMLANELHESAAKEGYESYDEVSFILAFVQSMPYTSDKVTTGYDEYPRFPVETLVDGGGDCEDTSILFATITLSLNYSTIFISPPNHCAVGVWGKNLTGSYYNYNERTYYYCETTGDDWKIGQIPDEYKDVSANLYSINENIQYEPSQGALPGGVVEWLTSTNQGLEVVILIIVALVIVSVVLLLYALSKKKSKPAEPRQPSMMPILSASTIYCRYCGSENRSDALVCLKCGKKLSES